MENNDDILSLLKEKKESKKEFNYFKDVLSGKTLDGSFINEEKVFSVKRQRRTKKENKTKNIKEYQRKYHKLTNDEKKVKGIKHFNFEMSVETQLEIEKIKSLTGETTQSILLKGIELLNERFKIKIKELLDE